MEAGAERASGAVRHGHHQDCARAQIAPTASTASAAAARALCRPVRRRSPQDGRCAGPQRRAPCARPQQLAEWLLLLFAACGGSSNGCLLCLLSRLPLLPAICCAVTARVAVISVASCTWLSELVVGPSMVVELGLAAMGQEGPLKEQPFCTQRSPCIYIYKHIQRTQKHIQRTNVWTPYGW